MDFVDFIPIESNADDFDLSSIIKEVSKESPLSPRSPNINFDNIDQNVSAPVTTAEKQVGIQDSENAPVPPNQQNFI